tara:strand:+ start:424 stop:573 length:150 start_codon:yes stop_codon:yes gene_type:complete
MQNLEKKAGGKAALGLGFFKFEKNRGYGFSNLKRVFRALLSYCSHNHKK